MSDEDSAGEGPASKVVQEMPKEAPFKHKGVTVPPFSMVTHSRAPK